MSRRANSFIKAQALDLAAIKRALTRIKAGACLPPQSCRRKHAVNTLPLNPRASRIWQLELVIISS